MPGKAGSGRDKIRAWRSTRLGGLIVRFNQQAAGGDQAGKPLTKEGRRNLLLGAAGLTIVAIAVRAPVFGTAYVAPDTTAYLSVAESVFHGGFPDNIRPPAYSLLLAVFKELGANPVTAVVDLQNLIGIFLPAAVLLVGRRFFGTAVGLIAGFLTAASPLMLVTEQLGLAEFLFGVLLLAATALLIEACWKVRAGHATLTLLIASGAMFGIATLFRANGMLAIVAIPLVLLFSGPRWRPALKASGVAIAAMLVVLAPWSLHNLIRFGNPNVATVENISLYARVVTWDHVPPPADTPDGRLALDLYNQGATPTALYAALLNEGRTSAEATSVMGQLARKVIYEHPDPYFSNAWNELADYETLFDPKTLTADSEKDQIGAARSYFAAFPTSNDVEVVPTTVLAARTLPGDSALTAVPWQIAQTLTRLLYLISIGGLLVLFLLFLGAPRQRLAAMVFVVVVLLGVLGSGFSSVFSPRYDIVFAPIVWLLLAATAVRIVEVANAALRRRRVAPADD